MNTTRPWFMKLASVACGMILLTASAAEADIHQNRKVTRISGADLVNPTATIDFIHARDMPLPQAGPNVGASLKLDRMNSQTGVQPYAAALPLLSAGGSGNGIATPVNLGKPAFTSSSSGPAVAPMDFGTSDHPYSISTADLSRQNSRYAPYAATGKLFFNIGTPRYMCSASLIKRGVIVTAAHCVANFGTGKLYSGWSFIPAYSNGAAPFGKWTAKQVLVPTPYLNGTDSCTTDALGVVCQDDVAVIVLNPVAGAYPGTKTGWYGYATQPWGFTTSGLTQITELGYPGNLNGGTLMERNDSQGFLSASNNNNTVIGTAMGGGSSGGPWLNNFGVTPTGAVPGAYADANTVVGVTSWGYTDNTVQEQGASPFTADNIGALMTAACPATELACQ